MKPLLAHTYEPHRVTYPCYVQPKLNGIRALYQAGRFQSRDQLPFAENLLAHLSVPLQNVFGPETILDGELYVHGWALQRINAAVTPVRQTPTEDTLKVEYHVFDVVDFGKSFVNRINLGLILKTTKLHPIHFVHTWPTINAQTADEMYAQYVSDGYEGMMYRLGDCPYTVPKQPNDCSTQVGRRGRLRFLSDQDNRTWHLLKRKDWQDDEFAVVGRSEGLGKQLGMLGSFICVTQGGQRFHVGSGISDAERQHYWDNFEQVKFIKVKYLCLSEAGIPLNPTILCIL